MNNMLKIGFLILHIIFLSSCNYAEKEAPINCIQEIKIVYSKTPNPPGIIAKLIIDDKELGRVLREYRIKKPLVKYCGSVFLDTALNYSEPKISNDSSHYFTFGSMLSFKSFQKSSVNMIDSILQDNLQNTYILITHSKKEWTISPCKSSQAKR